MLLKLEIHMKFENSEVLPIDRVRIQDRWDFSATVEYLWESNVFRCASELMKCFITVLQKDTDCFSFGKIH